MGILLQDKSADFSAISLGHAGLYTSITEGLEGLFELRRSQSKARNNSAPSNDLPATVGGGSVLSPISMALSAQNQINFPSGPTNSGALTIALIIKIKNGGAATDYPIGSVVSSPTSNGSAYFTHYNRQVRFDCTLFNAQNEPAVFVANASALFNAPSSGALDGTYQLFVATVKSQDSLNLYWPAIGQISSASIPAGRFAYFNQSAAGRAWRGLAGGTAAQELSMVAYWNRAISPAEVKTFYGEMKRQFSQIGLVI